MKYLLANSLSIVAALIAAFLAYEGVDYWGWFLVLAFLAGHSFTDSGKCDCDCDCKKSEK